MILTVEIVEIASGEIARNRAGHKRAKIRRNHGNHIQAPSSPDDSRCPACDSMIFSRLIRSLLLLLAAGFVVQLGSSTETLRQLGQVEIDQQQFLAPPRPPYPSVKGYSSALLLRTSDAWLPPRSGSGSGSRACVTGIDNDIVLEVDHLLETGGLHVQATRPGGWALLLKNQMCTTGAANSMWPIRLRRTRLNG